jgi:quinol monooxygenase YgiN
MPLCAFATITPRPEHFGKAREAIRAILARTRAETGCIRFELNESQDADRLHLYEIWADRAAFEAHHAADYTRAVFRQYEEWLAEPVAITFMRPVE